MRGFVEIFLAVVLMVIPLGSRFSLRVTQQRHLVRTGLQNRLTGVVTTGFWAPDVTVFSFTQNQSLCNEKSVRRFCGQALEHYSWCVIDLNVLPTTHVHPNDFTKFSV